MSVIKTLNKIADAKALELSSEKVELGLADDLGGSIKKLETAKKYLQDTLKSLKKADAAILKIQDIVDDAEGMQANTRTEAAALKEAGDIMNKLEKAVKDLGVPISSIPNWSKADKLWEDVDSLKTEVVTYELPKI
jgi:DNA repair ATPase RecN